MSSNLSSSFSQFKFEMLKGRAHSIYEFDGFRLEPANLMLYSGEKEVYLPPKAVEVLVVLVREQGEIVSKDDLIAQLWSDSVVEESNLSQYLYLLRKTLGKRADGTAYIETLRRRGYRFRADVRLIEQVDSLPSSQNKPHKPQATGRLKTSPVSDPQPRRLPVEHHGNVVAFSAWKDTERVKDGLPEVTQVAREAPIRWIWVFAAILLTIAVSTTTGYFLFSRDSASVSQPPPEIVISRLTSGIEPRGATISPDGKYFVYHEAGFESRMSIQQVGYSNRVEIVPDSDRPLCCTTFSPDSEFVYYLAKDTSRDSNSLYRVPKLGGHSAKIVDDIDSAVSFSPDGLAMVFSRHNREKNVTEYVIKASDGTGDERVIHTSPGNYSSAPAWSPDGRSVVFATSMSGEDGDYGLRSLDLQDGSLRAVSDESWDMCHRIMWKADGSGFYFIGTKRGDRLTAFRDQLYHVSYPDGRSRRITTDPTSRQQIDSIGVTNSGAVLTVPYNRASQIWVMDSNGDSRSAVQLTSGISDGRGGIAPLAGGRLAFIGRSGDNTNVFLLDEASAEQKPILADQLIPDEPRSSPGSPFLVFAIYNWPYSHLFRARADGSDLKQLTFGESREIDSSISNDGRWVAYGSLAVPVSEAEISLWKVAIDGGEPINLKQNNCLMPHFSPDDRLLSCIEDQKKIQILSADDGRLLRSISVTPLAWLNSGARWTPDGKSVAYIVTEKGISNIWSHPIAGGEPSRLTNFTTASIYNFAYSPDGTRIYLARGQQIRDAVLIREQVQ